MSTIGLSLAPICRICRREAGALTDEQYAGQLTAHSKRMRDVPHECCDSDYDAIFDERTAQRQLAEYRRSGPDGSTNRLIEAIKGAGPERGSVLDIGGGVGVIGLELLAAGARSLTGVDASHAYVAVARDEIERRGWGERATIRHGDFVQLAHEVEPVDIVTLDRVVCCYGEWAALVDASASRARRLYGLVFPNDRWWLRRVIGLANLALRLSGRSFRGYVHPERSVDERIRRAGFERQVHHRGWVWQTILYVRVGPGSGG